MTRVLLSARQQGTLAHLTRDLTPSQYPHVGGCHECRAAKLCNYCGGKLDAGGPGSHCTNGRCSTCHRDVCAPGGDTFPGHGYGKGTP